MAGALVGATHADDAQLQVGMNIKAAAEMRGIKIPDLARAVGISRSSFYDRLSGRTDLTVKEVRQIAAVLQVSVGGLFGTPEDLFAQNAKVLKSKLKLVPGTGKRENRDKPLVAAVDCTR